MWHRRQAPTPPAVLRSEARGCRDLAGHPAAVIVGVTADDQVTLTTPSGETVLFGPLQVGPVRDSLRAAAVVAGLHAAGRNEASS
jgi:hypothetical protein